MPHRTTNSPHAPALALILFFVGALLSLEAGQFGFSPDRGLMLLVMWALLTVSAMLQLSVLAPFFLPISALLFGGAAAAEARGLLSLAETGRILQGMFPMLLLIPLFFLLFCRGMRQGALLRSLLLEGRAFRRRELLFSLVIMIAAILLYPLYRFMNLRP